MSQRGSALAWTAALLGFVLVPLLLLVGDGARLYYVRGRLTTAADAACEDAAWSASDRILYPLDGQERFEDNWGQIGRAQALFYQMLAERAQVRFTPAITIQPDSARRLVLCQAQAQVPLLTTFGQEVSVRVSTSARMRFSR